MVAADDRNAVAFSLSPGQSGDAPEGRKLLQSFDHAGWEDTKVIMDKAYEGDETGCSPKVQPQVELAIR